MIISRNHFFALVIVSPALYAATPLALARMPDDEADVIDVEEQQGVETINDRDSYRYPIDWLDAFELSPAAFRTSAGSLSASRFEYTEEIKFRPNRNSNYVVGLEYLRQEDYFTNIQRHHVSLEGRITGDFWAGILGDSGSFKEYGDLGLSIAWCKDQINCVQLQAWSVDHFYNSKHDEDGASRSVNTKAYHLNLRLTASDKHRIKFSAYYDSPLKWSRTALGYDYKYESHGLESEWEWALSEIEKLTLLANYDRKREGKFGRDALTDQQKSLDRTHHEFEVVWQKKHDRTTLAVGAGNMDRDAIYTQTNLTGDGDGIANYSPPKVIRREQSLHIRHHSPVMLIGDFFQWGFFFNRVRLLRVENETEFESKLQTALDFRHGNNAWAFLNVTWDLDRVVENFPYPDSSQPFNPWGGANVQFMVTF